MPREQPTAGLADPPLGPLAPDGTPVFEQPATWRSLDRPSSPPTRPPEVREPALDAADRPTFRVRPGRAGPTFDPCNAACGGTALYPRTGELRQAGRLQRELLAPPRCRFGPLRIQIIYRPAAYLSGDVYDVQPLTSGQVGVALIDAAGSGMAGALLSMFLHRTLRGGGPRTGPDERPFPAQVLTRLNDELIAAQLSDCGFATAVFVQIDPRSGTALLARAGAPYPILRRRDGHVSLIRPAGILLGVRADLGLTVARIRMQPDDELLIHTDGVNDTLGPAMPEASMVRAAARASRPDGGQTDGSGARDDPLRRWCRFLGRRGVEPALRRLLRRHALRRRIRQADDLTVVRIRYGEASGS